MDAFSYLINFQFFVFVSNIAFSLRRYLVNLIKLFWHWSFGMFLYQSSCFQLKNNVLKSRAYSSLDPVYIRGSENSFKLLNNLWNFKTWLVSPTKMLLLPHYGTNTLNIMTRCLQERIEEVIISLVNQCPITEKISSHDPIYLPFSET